MRNTDVVRAFKKLLVKEFWEMRNQKETKPAFDPRNMTMMDVLQIAMGSEQEKPRLETKIENYKTVVDLIAPRARAFDRFEKAYGNCTLNEAAKL